MMARTTKSESKKNERIRVSCSDDTNQDYHAVRYRQALLVQPISQAIVQPISQRDEFFFTKKTKRCSSRSFSLLMDWKLVLIQEA